MLCCTAYRLRTIHSTRVHLLHSTIYSREHASNAAVSWAPGTVHVHMIVVLAASLGISLVVKSTELTYYDLGFTLFPQLIIMATRKLKPS